MLTYLFNLYHLRVSLTQRQLVIPDRYLDGISQRSDFTDLDLRILGDSHVHDPALYRAFAMKLNNLDRLSDPYVSQCFQFFLLLRPLFFWQVHH